MGIDKIDGFNTYAPFPTDKLRGKFADITARDALASAYRYEGLITYVVDSDGAGNGAIYALIDGITNSDWIQIANVNGTAKEKVTVNDNSFSGIEIGLNVFTHTKGTKDIMVQFKDSSGNILNLTPTVSSTTVSIVSGVTYAGAELIIL